MTEVLKDKHNLVYTNDCVFEKQPDTIAVLYAWMLAHLC